MSILKQQTHYHSWSELWEQGFRSRWFHAGYTPESFRTDLPLSERLLFTQSNARVLLGQDSTGRLAFLAAPHEQDYGIPTCTEGKPYPITACPGMFYQTDVAMWFGKAEYVVTLDDGSEFSAMNRDADTWYHEHFLPCGETRRHGMNIHVVSIAPVLEANAWKRGGIPGTPLPGPSGAIFTAVLENTGDRTLSGRCSLRFDRKIVIRSEYNGRDSFEADAIDPYYCAWERGVYTMFHPGCSVSLSLEGAVCSGSSSQPEMYVPFELSPGQSKVIECRIAVAPTQEGISGTIAQLYQHSTLDWINVTADFWKSRLGNVELSMDAAPESGEKYRDFQIRNILDDFNCLQVNADGRLLVHWQGAPSHNVGRFWGIDIEPTVNSVLYAIPEMGPCAIEYIADRNEPRFSVYTDHSTPIRAALPIIAAKYLELTGDTAYFQTHEAVMKALDATLERIMASKHSKYALFSSRYSSDGIVFHRYDVGTNVKVWLALRGMNELYAALNRPCPWDLSELCRQLQADALEQLTEEGPFGRQFIGGRTYGEDKEFYFRDDIYYYDGEDSTSCMMPVYGFCAYDEPAWVNYHRFARSIFCSNYDPEMQALRWFFYGGAVDGTAYISALGGSVTRSEMRAALENMIDCDLDDTGSLYWWPKGRNKRRCIARCSQGQGSWVIQDTEQWLGLRMNALENTLTFCPQGLITGYSWKNAKLGAYAFDLEWHEDGAGADFTVVNQNAVPVRVRFGARPAGAGCDGQIHWTTCEVQPGERLVQRVEAPCAAPIGEVAIPERELAVLGAPLFGTVGLQMPSAEQRMNAFLMRMVFVPEKDCSEVSVRVEVDDGWGICAKQERFWPLLTDVEDASAEHSGGCARGERFLAPFFIRLPQELDSRRVWSNVHPFMIPRDAREQRFLICGRQAGRAEIRAALSYTDADGRHELERRIPVEILEKEAFEAAIHAVVYGG